MKYEVPENADFAYNEDLPYIDEYTRNQKGFDLYMQKITELQSIFDLSDIERNFQENQYKQFALFCEKNKMYGQSNISGGEDVDMTSHENIKTSLQALIVRMEDKMNRFKRMVAVGSSGTPDESVIDTLSDLSNYANIAILVKDGKWI